MSHISPLLQALIDNLGESAAVVVLAILGIALTPVKVWWKERAMKRFERSINQNVRLRELLAELRVIYKADRAELWQLHNGEFYVSGTSIMRCSLTHYVTKTGIASPLPVQNIPTTHMLMTLKTLQDSATGRFVHGGLPDDNFQEALFAATGNSVVMAGAVRDLRKNWLGVLCVSWIDDPGVTSNDDITSYAQQIGEIISKKA